MLRTRDQKTSRFSLLDILFRYQLRRSSFDGLLVSLVAGTLLVASLIWLWQLNANHIQTVPATGGTLEEGIVGTPRFVNPILAITRADQDMVSLLYRSLYQVNASGTLEYDLAEEVVISDDGRVYQIKIKDNQFWHDGVAITAEDIVYTINQAQNPELKSPVRGNWNDVTVELLNDQELTIILEEPYVPFVENLTLGILPKHLWQNLSAEELPFSQYNTEPVGSGPFKLSNVVRDEDGLITTYQLTQFERYSPVPNIEEIIIRFYSNETEVYEALIAGDITHTAALNPERVASLPTETYTIIERSVPRVFALYPNQNRNPVLRDRAARAALSAAINRPELINTALTGFGTATYSPLPPGFGFTATSSTATSGIEVARTILEAGGWVLREDGGWEKEIDDTVVPLVVRITTANSDLFADTVEAIITTWQELGVDVSAAFFEQSDLVQAVIRPRDYELLLFGTEVGRALDFYPFWHSSQREDPGLNVALYTNLSTDEYLETYRITTDVAERATILSNFAESVTSETPAIFLFSPTFTYVTRSDLPINVPIQLNKPSERFATIASWHIESESLWPLFIHN